ncbi:SoxR reducing system RseC family protein [Propionivibrio sp.]|uniref:SoxR reducing system RseC family protein n=1 Tax=Propionivibrio sp. TaxID=2212460 RepID=UPI00262C8746|nr:SoxR reducing system RseC family protein [Propionivibrio sp.]
MIDAPGTITALDGDFATVLLDETGCGRCHEQGGCGGNTISKMFCSTPRTFRVLNPGKSAVGDRVNIAIAEGAVRRSAVLAYGLPLFSLFVGALGGSALAGEPGAIVGAVSGLFCAWLALRYAQGRGAPDQRFQPYIRY